MGFLVFIVKSIVLGYSCELSRFGLIFMCVFFLLQILYYDLNFENKMKISTKDATHTMSAKS